MILRILDLVHTILAKDPQDSLFSYCIYFLCASISRLNLEKQGKNLQTLKHYLEKEPEKFT